MNPKVKLAGASAAALVAVCVMGWRGYHTLGGGRTVRSASRVADLASMNTAVAGGGDVSGAVGSDGTLSGRADRRAEETARREGAYRFPKTDAALSVFDADLSALISKAEQCDALGSLGSASRRGLIESWRNLIRPFIAGDAAAFERAVADLGGVPRGNGADGSAASVLFDRIGVYLSGARIDLTSARIVAVDTSVNDAMPMDMPSFTSPPDTPDIPAGAVIPVMVGIVETVDGKTGETVRTRNMDIPLSSIFPGGGEIKRAGAAVYEVWAPAKLKGAGGGGPDIGPSVYFVRDNESGRWIPLSVRITLISKKANAAMDRMMRGG